MIGFGIDETQAEYVAEIKLRHLNKEYILKRTADIEGLKKDIAEMEEILGSDKKIKNIIVSELNYLGGTANKDIEIAGVVILKGSHSEKFFHQLVGVDSSLARETSERLIPETWLTRLPVTPKLS